MDIEALSFGSINFSGSIPEHYEQYLGPMFFEPYAIEISKAERKIWRFANDSTFESSGLSGMEVN